jgi:hypothetical protein
VELLLVIDAETTMMMIGQSRGEVSIHRWALWISNHRVVNNCDRKMPDPPSHIGKRAAHTLEFENQRWP